MNPFRFKIPRRAKICFKCKKSLVAPSSVQSLIRGEEEAPEREDYCLNCFDERDLPKDCWGHWEIDLKVKTKKLSFDQRAMELFIQKMQDEEERAALFLAQYLKRKKQLVLRSEIKKEGLLFFEDPQNEEVYALKKIDYQTNHLEELKKTLIQELETQEA